MRKFFSILLSIILIISLCIAVSVPGSAVFVVDDVLLYSIGISVAASIALSCGIAVASGQDNAFSTGANALGQMVYESLQEQYSQAQLLSMIVIANGKAYFKSPESLYTRIKNWLRSQDLSNLTVQNHITIANFAPSLTNSEYLSFSQYSNYFVYALKPSPLSIYSQALEINYVDGIGATIMFDDGSAIYDKSHNLRNNNGTVYCLSSLDVNCNSVLCIGSDSQNSQASTDLSFNWFNQGWAHLRGGGVISLTAEGNSSRYLVLPGSDTRHSLTYTNGEGATYVKIDNHVVCSFAGTVKEYQKRCASVGHLLINTDNDYLPVNTNSAADSTTVSVDTETYPPTIPDSQIGSDSSVMIPLPGNLVDPSNPELPLTQSAVKNRIKRGQSVEYVPEIERLNGVLPKDFPVFVTNTVTDTQVIDTPLSTTYIGDNSETYVVIPNNPGSVVIPGADDDPIVTYPYPDVINPGNETITVVNNPDVFPTRVPSETATAAPGETVAEITRVSEIVSEAVSDIVQPVTPEDIERGANKMKLSSQLLRKFPFCIPFDFYNAINQFSAPAETPVFDIPFHIQSINFDYNFHIDMSQFETAAKISRWFFSVTWVVILIFLTRKVIWK